MSNKENTQALIEAGEFYDFVDGIETADKLKPYDEGLVDVAQKAINGVKNIFGTSAAAAQRNKDTAQTAANTVKTNAETEQLQPPAEAAQQIINMLNKALKKDQKLVDKNAKQQQKADTNKAIADKKAEIENNQQAEPNDSEVQ